MAKRFKKKGRIVRKESEQFEKFKHMRVSKKDIFIQNTIDFILDKYEKVCSFFFDLFQRISSSSFVTGLLDKLTSLKGFFIKDNSHLRYCDNKKSKIIDFNQAKRLRESEETQPSTPKRFKKDNALQRVSVKHFKDYLSLDKAEAKFKFPFRNKTVITTENLPTTKQLEAELHRERSKKSGNSLVRNTIFSLITISAVVVLIAIFILPVFQIYGTSMQPTLQEGDILVAVKSFDFERGDIISFYYNNKILVKRVIAFEGEYVDIKDDGTVYVNSKEIKEPYLDVKALGDCDVELPYQVPAGKMFVLGDYRATSIDSRNTVMGCVSEEQLIGEIIFRVWPLNSFGSLWLREF